MWPLPNRRHITLTSSTTPSFSIPLSSRLKLHGGIIWKPPQKILLFYTIHLKQFKKMNRLEKCVRNWHISGVITAQRRCLMLWVSRKAISYAVSGSEGRSAWTQWWVNKREEEMSQGKQSATLLPGAGHSRARALANNRVCLWTNKHTNAEPLDRDRLLVDRGRGSNGK